jgi:hypothetical protein
MIPCGQVSALFNAGRILLELSRPAKAIQVLLEAEHRGREIGFNSQQGILNLLGEAHQVSSGSKLFLWHLRIAEIS